MRAPVGPGSAGLTYLLCGLMPDQDSSCQGHNVCEFIHNAGIPKSTVSGGQSGQKRASAFLQLSRKRCSKELLTARSHATVLLCSGTGRGVPEVQVPVLCRARQRQQATMTAHVHAQPVYVSSPHLRMCAPPWARHLGLDPGQGELTRTQGLSPGAGSLMDH